MFILADFFWHPMKGDTGGNGPMREEGISIYLSVGSKEASDVGKVVGGFFSGHPMKGEHWRQGPMKEEGILPLAGGEQGSERCRDSCWRVSFRASNERWTLAETDQ
jgi:hypothetical protein